MRVLINDGKKMRELLLPTGFVVNFIIKKAICENTDKKKTKVTTKTLREIRKCLKKYKKENGSFTLVEVYENDKECVKIIL